MKKVLVSINGNQDPFSSSHGRPPADGPIVSLLEEISDFDEVVLFYTPDRAQAAAETKAVLARRYPAIKTRLDELAGLDDPTHYEQILAGLRRALKQACPRDRHTRYWVSVSSGTSQMHACWLLLTASGEFQATVLQVREKRLVKQGQPLISEINPRATEYPLVRPHLTMETIPEVTPRRVEEAMADANLIAHDPQMKAALEQAANTAQYEQEIILIIGPSGTGKELMARFIHHVGKRRHKGFEALNCGALTETLIDSELFGHVKGAFTGADKNRIGKIESCHGGTVFLDEIGEMPLGTQTRMLRLLDQRELTPVGASKARKVDVQFIAATNRDLKEAIHQKLFRQDFYYRLSAHVIELPPLKDRGEDIAVIAAKLLDDFGRQNKKQSQVLSAKALEKLRQYHWPGNVRELKNVIRRAAVNCPAGRIGPEHIHLQDPDTGQNDFSGLPEPREGFDVKAFLDGARERLYNRAWEMAEGNGSRAAALLGVAPQAVHKHRKNRKTR